MMDDGEAAGNFTLLTPAIVTEQGAGKKCLARQSFVPQN
jgi:hypothetical protein